MAAATSTLDLITLVVAIVGVLLAALSLGWQAATFLLSGSRVRVTLRRGALRRELGQTSLVSYPKDVTDANVAVMRDQGFLEDVAVAEVSKSWAPGHLCRERLHPNAQSVGIFGLG